ncbi:MAG TPA: cyanophycinase [Patescibacteria group bacterium]|nr:cyanophycinase [Patescibacteria group bacterium]
MKKNQKTHHTKPAPGIKKIPKRGTPRGNIIVIGGHEDKEQDKIILEEIAKRAGRGKLIVSTMASEVPDQQWEDYRKVFRELGVKRVERLDIRQREDIMEDPRTEIFDGANVMFFAGGDQLKITSKIGGTPLCTAMRKMYHEGGTIAGTSSGASVMGETMLIAGPGATSPERETSGRMAPGLGFLSDVLIDQHFAERGRIGRLMGAVALNPRVLGLGIDEDTALIFARDFFTVVGNGSVYVIDGRGMKHSGFAQDEEQEKISIYGLKLHLLTQSDRFLLKDRRPVPVGRDNVEAELKRLRPKPRAARKSSPTKKRKSK